MHKLKQKGNLRYGKWARDDCGTVGSRICGIQTWVEPDQGSGDDSAVNEIKFLCC